MYSKKNRRKLALGSTQSLRAFLYMDSGPVVKLHFTAWHFWLHFKILCAWTWNVEPNQTHNYSIHHIWWDRRGSQCPDFSTLFWMMTEVNGYLQVHGVEEDEAVLRVSPPATILDHIAALRDSIRSFAKKDTAKYRTVLEDCDRYIPHCALNAPNSSIAVLYNEIWTSFLLSNLPRIFATALMSLTCLLRWAVHLIAFMTLSGLRQYV